MKDREKNRDPERARKRAVADARCALRKLGLLEWLEDWQAGRDDDPTGLLSRMAEVLGLVARGGSDGS